MRIEVFNASKRFGRIEALRSITFSVPSGGRTAIIGPNGSGKSTLIRALLGLVACNGEIRIDGLSPYESRVRLAGRIAYVPQIAPALGASVSEILDVIALTRDLPMTSIEREGAHFDLDIRALGRRTLRELSGGMKQKLLLSVAFATAPTLLILDEPTASLDERARQQFFNRCESLPEAATVLLCSHRFDDLERVTTGVVALSEGQVSFSGQLGDYQRGETARLTVTNREALA